MRQNTIGREDLVKIQAWQMRVKDIIRQNNVIHPADLPISEILAIRADRLERRD